MFVQEFVRWLTNYKFLTRLTRRVSLVEQEHLSLSEHLGSPRCLVGLVLLDLWFYVYVL
jgi:hypothetical protein